MKHLSSIIIFLYFGFLLLLAPINLLSFDTYYYWDWSRHLALSYYDGSPMIAYFIKLSTLLFGDTLFALSFVGITCAALTSWIIYKTARLFLSEEASCITMLLWLFAPLVTLDILKQTTYDIPLMLFWALTLYYTVKFITFDKIKYLYFVGASIGLMMLSKYSGIVLVLSLFIFLLTTPYRYLFKTPHLYLTLLLAIAIFSPVILWNKQHEWQSFLYQLTTHQIQGPVNPLFSAIKSFFLIFLPSLNFMLLLPTIYWLKRAPAQSQETNNERNDLEKNDVNVDKVSCHNRQLEYTRESDRILDKHKMATRLCLTICSTLICFYLFVATKDTIRDGWLAPYIVTSALLGGYCFQTFHFRKSTFLLIIVYIIATLGIVVNNAFPNLTIPPKFIYYHLIQTFNASYPTLPKTIITPGWLEARMLFFLTGKPQVYTLNCGAPQNQYALWSTDVAKKIKNKALKEVLYIDIHNRVSCVKKYFDECSRLSIPAYPYKNNAYTIFAYTCTNHEGKI